MIDILRDLGLPISISSNGPAIDETIALMHWLMLFLFIGWGTFFIVSLVKFRKSKSPQADYIGVKSHISTVFEVAVALIEIVLLIGFSFPIWASRVNDVPTSNEGIIHVRVVAQQYAWNIHYPGPDGIFGSTQSELVDEVSNPVGLDRSSFGASDDFITINQLHIPVNKKVRIDLTTKDVIHSFKLPELRVGQDAIPGMSIPMHFEATMTSDQFLKKMVGTPREGKGLEISCAQLCGLGHYRMRGYLTVDTEEEYNDWLSLQAEYLLEDNEEDEWGDEEDW
ncbi:MAG: cytochrome c oxidase subunit II [Candidatus Neomarinimicrobiota bacterium]|nr:cytochrome c oxidase subunit II [Candidatus Neomarinimicrobiota bacterium]MEE3196182.1 cytochrome c oxidase subunit II [Candidatus Neomarinimicrobiota bacterium]